MNKFPFILVSVFILLSSCSVKEQENSVGSEEVRISVSVVDTKTQISGNSIVFDVPDKMTLSCHGINQGIVSNANTNNRNVFEGRIPLLGISRSGCLWYTVYPSTASVDINSASVSGTLSAEQKAPFDQQANFMYSDYISADYDEVNPPELSAQMNQIMGLVRVSFSCNDVAYASDKIESVQIRASENLAGDFTFGLNDHAFSLTSDTHRFVASVYAEPETLGRNTVHTVNMFVAPTTLTGITLYVRTDKHTFTYRPSGSFQTEGGKLSVLPCYELSSWEISNIHSTLRKRVVCWGSSSTDGQYTYTTHLQELLGDDWVVYNGGRSGDRSYEIAARQGAVPVVTGDTPFTIEATPKLMYIDPLKRTRNIFGEEGLFPLRRFQGNLVNPCIVVGQGGQEVLCDITSSFHVEDNGDTTYYAHLKRRSPGSGNVYVPANSPVYSYGSRELRDADLMILQVGANGCYGMEGEGGKYYGPGLDNLIEQHWEMIDYAPNSNYIVLGFQNQEHLENWDYSQKMEQAFQNQFLNLRTEVIKDRQTCIHWLLESGVFASEADIPEAELQRAQDGHWPHALEISLTDRHPNDYGSYVIAAVIYNKMQELGYLDN